MGDPKTPVPTATLGISRLDALNALHQHGAHFVLCKMVPKQAGGYRKPPIQGWTDWPNRRPGFDLVRLHERKGDEMVLGMVPASISNTALDLDSGNPDALIRETRPHTHYATMRPGGHHLWYQDTEGRNNGEWRLFGCSGEVRSLNGYLILYGDAPQRLVSALVLDTPAALFPADLFEWANVRPPPSVSADSDASDPEWQPAYDPDAPVGGWIEPATTKLEHVYRGRTFALFYVVRKWAYVQPFRRYDLDEWVRRVQSKAVGQDTRFPFPLGVAEAERVGYSVATWTWHTLEFGRDPESQAHRGRLSGVARRRQTEARDRAICEFVEAGLSDRQVEAAMAEGGHLVGKSTVGDVRRRLVVVRPDYTMERDDSIKAMYAAGWTQQHIGQTFGLTRRRIGQILLTANVCKEGNSDRRTIRGGDR